MRWSPCASSSPAQPAASALAAPDATQGLPTDVDVLVNNTGIQHVSPVHELPVDVFEPSRRTYERRATQSSSAGQRLAHCGETIS